MIVPGNFFIVYELEQRSSSSDNTNSLAAYVKPFIDSFESADLILQQDNASIHVSKETQAWLKKEKLKTMSSPAKSPDLNIIENVWSVLSTLVNDGPQFSDKQQLWEKIQRSAEIINVDKQDCLESLRLSMPRRLLTVIERKGDMTDY